MGKDAMIGEIALIVAVVVEAAIDTAPIEAMFEGIEITIDEVETVYEILVAKKGVDGVKKERGIERGIETEAEIEVVIEIETEIETATETAIGTAEKIEAAKETGSIVTVLVVEAGAVAEVTKGRV